MNARDAHLGAGRGAPPGGTVPPDPPRRLAPGGPPAEPPAGVELRLEPKSSGTAVYLVKTGYPPGHEATVLRDRGMWSDLLVCLKNFVEGGDAGFANAYDAQVRES